MLVLIIIVIVNILTYLYFPTYTYAYLFLKYSELEKCRCVPQIAFRDKKFQKTSCFYTDVLKTRERSLCTSDWVPGNKISKQQGFGSTRLNPCCLKTSWFHTEVEKSFVFPEKNFGPVYLLVVFGELMVKPDEFQNGPCASGPAGRPGRFTLCVSFCVLPSLTCH